MKRNQEEAYFLKLDRELINQMRISLQGPVSTNLNAGILQTQGDLFLRYLDKILKLDERWLADI